MSIPNAQTDRPKDIARRIAGRAVRRAAREAQWRLSGIRFATDRGEVIALHVLVAEHASPLFRDLAGMPDELQRNKVANLRLAASRLDGVVLRPGERLSFWRLVGRPTYRRGFLDGAVLSHGCVLPGVGGGLCQMTNMLYWLTLHTPLTVVERWRHSYDVFPDSGRTQPFGSGATCAWPALDLQVENRTSAAFRLRVAVGRDELAGSWWSAEPPRLRYEVREDGHRITHDGPGRYVRHNRLYRRSFDESGAFVAEELVAENHALMMYEPFLPARSSV